MAGLVLDDHRIIRRCLVKLGQGGTEAAWHAVLVKIPDDDPLPGLWLFLLDPVLNNTDHFFGTVDFGQRDLQKREGQLEEMAVGIQKGRKKRSAFQVLFGGVWRGGR